MGRIRERNTVFGVHSPSTFNGKKIPIFIFIHPRTNTIAVNSFNYY